VLASVVQCHGDTCNKRDYITETNGAQPAAFDSEICGRPHVIWNTRFGGRAGEYWSKTNARQENQSTQCVTIWIVMSQRVIDYRMNTVSLFACVLCWLALGTLAVVGNHSSKCALCELAAVLHINKSNTAGNSTRLYTPDKDDWHWHESYQRVEKQFARKLHTWFGKAFKFWFVFIQTCFITVWLTLKSNRYNRKPTNSCVFADPVFQSSWGVDANLRYDERGSGL